MPRTVVVFYRESSGEVPVLNWLKQLRKKDLRGYKKCVARIHRLELEGYELRRPSCDYLRNGVYELHARRGRLNYRILYFFHTRNRIVLACGFSKEGRLPASPISRAIRRKAVFDEQPARHFYQLEI